jgi:hypothetical protein
MKQVDKVCEVDKTLFINFINPINLINFINLAPPTFSSSHILTLSHILSHSLT